MPDLSKRARNRRDKRAPWDENEDDRSVAEVAADKLVHRVAQLFVLSLQGVRAVQVGNRRPFTGPELRGAQAARSHSFNVRLRPPVVQRAPLLPGFRKVHERLL